MFSQLNPEVIIQTDASLTGWGAVCNEVQTSGQWSEEERCLHINLLELLAIKLALFSFARGKRVKVIHFQIDNKAAVLPFENWGNKERKYDQIEQRDLAFSSQSQYGYHSRILAFSTECSSRQRIKKKTRLFRLASSSQSFSSCFSPTRFSDNRSICFLPMPPTTSIYSQTSRSLQSRDRCNDTKLKHRSSLCISPFQYDFKSAPKNKTGMFLF